MSGIAWMAVAAWLILKGFCFIVLAWYCLRSGMEYVLSFGMSAGEPPKGGWLWVCHAGAVFVVGRIVYEALVFVEFLK